MINTDPLITEDEIRTVRANAKTITREEALRGPPVKVKLQSLISDLQNLHALRGPLVKVTPLILASGYKVSMTLDDAGTGRVIEHVSVYYPSGRTDPADAEIIARAVLGEGYMVLGDGTLLKENKHFIKIKKREEK